MTQMARLIIDPPQDARKNMAIDSALFKHVKTAPLPATLRLYGWTPHAISIGRRQKHDEVDMKFCHEMGIGVVKRPGGGVAVYHNKELTYSFVCSVGDFPAPSAKMWRDLFRRFLNRLNLTPDEEEKCLIGEPKDRACFSCAEEDEPTVGGRKFVGSARRKSRSAYLQHGSILLESQPEFFQKAVKNAGTINSVGLCELSPGLTLEKIRDELVLAVAEAFCLGFIEGGYTPEEMESVKIIEGLEKLPPLR
jgi:lipoate-protein ligase A